MFREKESYDYPRILEADIIKQILREVCKTHTCSVGKQKVKLLVEVDLGDALFCFCILLFSVYLYKNGSGQIHFYTNKQVYFKQFSLAYKMVPFQAIQFSCQNSPISSNSV